MSRNIIHTAHWTIGPLMLTLRPQNISQLVELWTPTLCWFTSLSWLYTKCSCLATTLFTWQLDDILDTIKIESYNYHTVYILKCLNEGPVIFPAVSIHVLASHKIIQWVLFTFVCCQQGHGTQTCSYTHVDSYIVICLVMNVAASINYVKVLK